MISDASLTYLLWGMLTCRSGDLLCVDYLSYGHLD